MKKLNKEFKKVMSLTTKLVQSIYDAYIHHDVDNVVLQKDLIISYTYKGDGGYNRDIEDFVDRYISLPASYKKTLIINAKELFNPSDLSTDKIEIWPSNKMRFAYLGTNYYECTGHLGSSCMRHKENQKSLNFYVKNKVKIVVLVTKDNKIKARALLWENINAVGYKKTYTYLDRLYYSRESQRTLFRDFAKKNGFTTECKDFYIEDINLEDISHLPYTDTFRKLYYKDKVLSMGCMSGNKIKFPDKVVELIHAGNQGYFPQLDKNSIRECFTNNWASKKDCTFIKQYKGHVHKSNILNISGVYYSRHDSKNISCLGDKDDYCLSINVVKEVFTSTNIDKTKGERVDKYDGWVQKENIIYINKELYSKLDKDVVRWNKKYYLKKQCYCNTLSNTLIPKSEAIVAYRLGFKEYTNRFVTESTLFGIEGKQVLCDTEQRDVIPELVGPYYVDDSVPCVILNTGEHVMNCPPVISYTKEEKQRRPYIVRDAPVNEYIIRRNKKNYLRHSHTFKDKKQLVFNFGS